MSILEARLKIAKAARVLDEHVGDAWWREGWEWVPSGRMVLNDARAAEALQRAIDSMEARWRADEARDDYVNEFVDCVWVDLRTLRRFKMSEYVKSYPDPPTNSEQMQQIQAWWSEEARVRRERA